MAVEYSLSKETEKNKSYTVAKANDLVREARYSLSLGEQRTLDFLISKIPPQAKSFDDLGSPGKIGWVTFQVQEFARVFDMDPNNGMTYKHVKQWLLSLKKQAWWVKEADGTESIMSWLDEVKAEPKSGRCSITFHKTMQPYLVALTERGNYTSYSLAYTTKFRSSYSRRFYELFKSYEFRSEVKDPAREHVKTITEDLEDLKSKFDETDPVTRKVTKTLSNYTYKDFKRILDKSIEEINQYSDIDVEYTPIKKGKKVIQITFRIRSVMGLELHQRMLDEKREEAGVKKDKSVPGQMDFWTPIGTTEEPV